MKTIPVNATAAAKLCGRQTSVAGKRYRMTRHCLQIPCANGTLLFHTLTERLILLESENEWETERDALIGDWFLVPEDHDENAHADSVRCVLQALHPRAKGVTKYTILTTTECNARCRYCYEMGMRRTSMSRETAADVAEYIVRRSAGQRVTLQWFGGEPLYHSESIDVICALLRARGVAYRSTMTSNGYYLDAEMLRRAVECWHLKAVQITLDGTKEVYQRVKAYIDEDGNSYERVLGNIALALDAGVEVYIRLNVDGRNANDIMNLCDELAERFRGIRGLYVAPALLGNYNGCVGAFTSDMDKAEKYLSIIRKVDSLGFARPETAVIGQKSNACKADNDACEIILPDGGISKCMHYLDKDIVGSIYGDSLDIEKVGSWKEETRLPDCSTCPFYPRCYLLKKCISTQMGCSEASRMIQVGRIQDRILEMYRSYVDEQAREEENAT